MPSTLRRTLLVTALAATAALAAPASASDADDLRRQIQSSLSEGNVNVVVDDGTATLTGDTDSISRAAAERAALASDEVDRVVNLINAM